jgi:ornithine carbamoyltransferase
VYKDAHTAHIYALKDHGMSINLKGRSLLTLKDFSRAEISHLLDLSKKLKEKKRSGIRGELLDRKNIVLIFDKTSTRTRCAFEVAIWDEGGNATFLTNSQMGKKESIEDTAIVLGRYYDGIQYRGFSQKTAEILARGSGVPVWNGLTDEDHPTQVLADFMTIQENVDKDLRDVVLVYSGDGRNNMSNALLIGAAKMGMKYRILAPKELWPTQTLLNEMAPCFAASGGTVECFTIDESKKALKGADVLYTDVWVSMGEEAKMAERIKLLEPYRVTKEMLAMTENGKVVFLHCLPAFHDRETTIGQEVYEKFGVKEMEVSNEVFHGPHSKVFDQAENRMHTIKAVMVASLSGA